MREMDSRSGFGLTSVRPGAGRETPKAPLRSDESWVNGRNAFNFNPRHNPIQEVRFTKLYLNEMVTTVLVPSPLPLTALNLSKWSS